MGVTTVGGCESPDVGEIDPGLRDGMLVIRRFDQLPGFLPSTVHGSITEPGGRRHVLLLCVMMIGVAELLHWFRVRSIGRMTGEHLIDF